jgi:hypothetical protein
MAAAYGAIVYLLRAWPVAMWLALVVCNPVFDYAQVRAVVEDRRSMVGALVASLSFLRRNWLGAGTIYVADAAIFAAVVLAYSALGPASMVLGVAIRPRAGIEQLYVIGRAWARVVFWATETAFFQSRLAHAGYVAAPPVTWPDSPSAEAVQR